MELFNETRNNYFLNLVRLINLIVSSENIIDTDDGKNHVVSSKMIKDIFEKEIARDKYYIWTLKDFISIEVLEKLFKENKYIDDLSLEKDDEIDQNGKLIACDPENPDNIYTRCDKSIKILPSRAELTWLKTALKDYRATTFFTEKEVKDLNSFLNKLNTDNTFDKYIDICHEDIFGERVDQFIPSDSKTASDSYSSKLHLILRCLHENRFLKYSYKNGKGIKGRKENKISTPYKIEYSITKDQLKLSLKNDPDAQIADTEERERPVKGIIKKYYDLQMLDVNEEKTNLQELVNKRKSALPLVLHINSYNTDILKKMLTVFAKYDRTISFNSDESYTVKFNYYTFLEDDLIDDIISFGPNVVIESPKDLRNKMIEKLKSSDW